MNLEIGGRQVHYLYSILIALAVLIFIVLWRSLRLKTPVITSLEAKKVDLGIPNLVDRLSQAIQIETVSHLDLAEVDPLPFAEFRSFLEKSYPLFHRELVRNLVNEEGLVYKWEGSDTSLEPVLFTAHYDVVPVDEASSSKWTHPGFSGHFDGERIWGRGTLDIKSQLLSYFEVVENLIKEGYQPRRSFYFAFGQDEECSGLRGAFEIARYFADLKIKFAAVYDEGGIVVSGALAGVKSPVCVIGTAEKGYADFKITVPGEGGHSSTPPKSNAVSRLAKAITAVEKVKFKARLIESVRILLTQVSGEMGFAVKMIMANLFLFKPLLMLVLAKNPATNALVRTNFSINMLKASEAANVLPRQAEATINVRLLPGDTIDEVLANFQAAVSKYGAEVSLIHGLNPSLESPLDSKAYSILSKRVANFYPNAIIAPYLTLGATDARKYELVSREIYRLTPIWVTDAEKDTMHNVDENISLANYQRMIAFFEEMIQVWDQED